MVRIKEQGNIIIVPTAILYVLLDNMQESNEFGTLKYYTCNWKSSSEINWPPLWWHNGQ